MHQVSHIQYVNIWCRIPESFSGCLFLFVCLFMTHLLTVFTCMKPFCAMKL